MTVPVKEKLVIFRGGIFKRRYRVLDANSQPVNLSGYSARMQIRESWESDTVELELTTANTRLQLNNVSGLIDLTILATEAADLNITSGVFDLELVPSGGDSLAIKIAYGTVRVMPEATR